MPVTSAVPTPVDFRLKSGRVLKADTQNSQVLPSSSQHLGASFSMVNRQRHSPIVTLQSSLSNRHSPIVTLQSSLSNRHSPIVNLQSSICNRQSAIVNLQSSVANSFNLQSAIGSRQSV